MMSKLIVRFKTYLFLVTSRALSDQKSSMILRNPVVDLLALSVVKAGQNARNLLFSDNFADTRGNALLHNYAGGRHGASKRSPIMVIFLLLFMVFYCTKAPSSSSAYISGKLNGTEISSDRFEKMIAAVIGDTLVIQLVKGDNLYATRITKVTDGKFEGSYQLLPSMHETSFAVSRKNKLEHLATSGNVTIEKFRKGKNGFVKGTVSSVLEKGSIYISFEILLSPQFS